MLTLTVTSLFSDNLSANGYGKTKEAAEKEAYTALSKIIRVSVFNEEILIEEDTNGNLESSKFSTTSFQTTENNFINIEKSFKIEKDNFGNDIYLCTVIINDSAADSYIDIITNDYLVTIASLENKYEKNKETLSFENKKNLITNIIETYEDYDMAKYVLIALDKFTSDLPRPNQTIAIWQNEYQNILINYSNDLQKQKEDLNSNKDLSKDLINKQIDEINIEIAQANIELNIKKEDQEKASKLISQQKIIEIENEVNIILNSIIKKDIEIINNDNSLIQQIEIFDDYYNQYKSLIEKYENLIASQEANYIKEKQLGKIELLNRPYLYSEVDKNNEPTIVAKKIRNSEVNNFLIEKENEKLLNIKIIDGKMLPILNKLQNNLLMALSSIESSDVFTLSLIPKSINVNLDNEAKAFILDLYFNESNYINFEYSIKIPFENLDEKLNFNINDKNFDPSNALQMKSYENYKLLIDKYKKLLANQTFITYKFDFKTAILPLDNYYEIVIENEVKELTIIRNDYLLDNIVYKFNINDLNSFKGNYSDFLIANNFIDESYYNLIALDFYNKINLSEKTRQKEIKKRLDKILWAKYKENPKYYLKDGIKLNYGYSYYNESEVHYLSLSYNYPFYKYLYCGASIDVFTSIEQTTQSDDISLELTETETNNFEILSVYVRPFPIIGIFYPWETKNGVVIKPYVDYRFHYNFYNNIFTSLANVGVDFPIILTNKKIINSNIKFQIQLSGDSVGLCNFSFGFDPKDLFCAIFK